MALPIRNSSFSIDDLTLHKSIAAEKMKKVTFEEWESGQVKLQDEFFDPIFGSVIGYTFENNQIITHKKVLGYKGEETGTVLGTWFSEVCEN